MSKMLGSIATAAMLVALAVPSPAAAAGRHESGIQSGIHKQVTDFSSQRRVHRRYYVRRHVVRRYYGYYGHPYYYGYGYPYYGPYPYYRPYPYYAPGAYFRFGPFGFGVW